MHIPDSLLHGSVCPLSAACAAAGLGAAAVLALRSKEKPAALRFAAVTALVFSVQMLNAPIAHGTSGHVLGSSLAVFLLGGPFGILAMALVLAVQALLFADGGTLAVGANLLNMALIASLPAILARRLLERSTGAKALRTAVAAFCAGGVSVILASAACSLELAASGSFPLSRVLSAMTTTHAVVGLGEGAATALLVSLAAVADGRTAAARTETGLMALAALAILLSPLASAFPDGLERVAAGLGGATGAEGFVSFFAGYRIPGMGEGALSVILAGAAGAALCFAAGLLIGASMRLKRAMKRAAAG